MKKLLVLSLAAVAMIATSCSTSDDVADNNITETPGNGYLSVKIELPSTPATRAANDDFKDGTAAEYTVNSAYLYLFKGTTEDGAVFLTRVTLNSKETAADPADDNITVTHLTVGKVETAITVGASEKLYALAVINNNTLLNPSDLTGKTFGDVKDLTSSDAFHTSGANFVMLNAPISNVAGGSAASAPTSSDVTILTVLDPTRIFKTEAEAKAKPAGSIYVERAVAKATVGYDDTAITMIKGMSDYTINSVEWALDNKEPNSYIVRNMGDLSYIGYSSEAFTTANYRMVGNTMIGTTALQPIANLYRTYWCVDPQYSVDATGLVAANPTLDYNSADGSTPAYCHENTFDVIRQSYENTTRAIIKVTVNGAADFYTIAGDETKYDEDGAKDLLKAKIILNAGLKAALDAKCIAPYTLTAADIDITTSHNSTTGVYSLTGVTFKSTSTTFVTSYATYFSVDPATILSGCLSDLVDEVNDGVTLYKYVGGVVYYDARFMHFASNTPAADLAPWNTWEEGKGYTKPAAGNTTKAYPDGGLHRGVNYLGRWGMVRNNWYDVEILSFNELGHPVVPSISGDPTPDDNIPEKFISVKINVLSWAKRTQGWSF